MKFNEDSRVKIPSILHLCRLGYKYLSLKEADWDPDTNIFTKIFTDSIVNINDDFDNDDAKRLYKEIALLLENEDLGKAFYKKLINNSGAKLIDFDDFENNSFHVVTELPYKNGDDEFRPDIILLINGIPFSFIEVKKPNNRDGIKAERDRINKRFQNNKFRKFINVTQFMVFSNNMEYDDSDIDPLQGAFYASPSYAKPIFNYFREEESFDLKTLLKDVNEKIENAVLKDNNLYAIKQSPEFKTNKNPKSPTNRILTSLYNKERLKFILKYAIAYVDEHDGIQKHIMRYPQLFATKAIEERLKKGGKKGIIWHTQGSGKTALAYYNVRYLMDYFQKQNIIPKFYFIVDRMDLLRQAKREFSSRGLVVHIVNSRQDFVKEIKTSTAIHNASGKPEITVINIQKFSEDSHVVSKQDYNINIQRIYFLDEVHRSYNPKGSFLANLTQSDPDSIKIGLTGTPLINKDYYSKHLFGNYIHKYFYNRSIADGYTLRLIREEIQSDYRIKLKEALEQIKVAKGEIEKRKLYSHPRFVEPMLDYVVDDFEKSRLTHNDASIGGMVVCDSADQARTMNTIFQEKYAKSVNPQETESNDNLSYSRKISQSCKIRTAALILHDEGTKDERKDQIDDFKAGEIDLLFVYNMLLTGFDSPRLKKLYVGRIIKRHNLLQALTRVNRTYKRFRYGYVVDFADILDEFEATNRDYLKELQEELGDDFELYSNLFKSADEIEEEIIEIKEILFSYETDNAEIFSQQISKITDRPTVLDLKKALGNAKELYNIIRLQGHYELLEKANFKKLNQLYQIASDHLTLLNTKEALENDLDNTNLLNVVLEDVIFRFQKVSEEELVLADELKDILGKTREALDFNFDKKDPKFITLYDELKRLFHDKKLDEVKQEEMSHNIGALRELYKKVKELNRENDLLQIKYSSDKKYARIHKRLIEDGSITMNQSQLLNALKNIKEKADELVLQNTKALNNETHFERRIMQLVIQEFKDKQNLDLDVKSSKFINALVVKEYLDNHHGRN